MTARPHEHVPLIVCIVILALFYTLTAVLGCIAPVALFHGTWLLSSAAIATLLLWLWAVPRFLASLFFALRIRHRAVHAKTKEEKFAQTQQKIRIEFIAILAFCVFVSVGAQFFG